MSFAPLLRKPEAGGLRIGPVNDSFEREADRVAAEVVDGGLTGARNFSIKSMGIGSPLSRKCSCGGSGECEECKKRTLQRKTEGEAQSGYAPPIVDDVLRSSGHPLDAGTRGYFETRFGYDFSHVRVHTDARARQSAASVGALAFTVGNHVVFGDRQYAPESNQGRKLLAHELTHTVQQSGGVLQRKAADQPKEPKADFSGCDEPMQNDLRGKQGPALDHVRRAIQSLSAGWDKMNPADRSAFQRFFDPAGSGEIDDGFVKDVRANYQRILGYMSSLTFDCDLSSKTLCGSGEKWCVGGRLMWTCFGALHVCPDAYRKAGDPFKIETMIHESVHNALHTTDREYSNSAQFNRLKPRGSGILSFLSKIPILGAIFRLFRSNNDTLNNPDSYSGFAMEV